MCGVRCVWLCASVCAHTEDGHVCPAPAATWYPSDCTCPCLRVCTISATRRFFCSAWYELRRAITACHVDLARSHTRSHPVRTRARCTCSQRCPSLHLPMRMRTHQLSTCSPAYVVCISLLTRDHSCQGKGVERRGRLGLSF
jgi:hypothetical protein